ncbi:hypothetical protein ABEY41_28465 [Peribacillus butanolivorans]|uniref:hypothetical protein n=1 Tax=Peribacillus butanolivorans TaxID=421767 RepID=UPI0030C99370
MCFFILLTHIGGQYDTNPIELDQLLADHFTVYLIAGKKKYHDFLFESHFPLTTST